VEDGLNRWVIKGQGRDKTRPKQIHKYRKQRKFQNKPHPHFSKIKQHPTDVTRVRKKKTLNGKKERHEKPGKGRDN